ncbi:exonuclease domain-containing protein [Macrococcus equipercicus]|uniref:3'-5' exoribonuclease n=1 Tax=Macrococcus equipercicus TaxID=69967 RepID=A0A9Q9F1I8_9STAP|nr:hypothetical protein ERX35_009040 [Macrococcus equipercicus]UTH13406.1 3'-5' exoribonuclease [Macrococcus equipercicus]
MTEFIALDFETANGQPASICSVGMVKVQDNMMTETFYTLVNPETYFSKGNIAVHGIKPEDVTDAPLFPEVYQHMLDFIGELPVVAHFARFDMNVLYASIERYNLDMPTLKYFCSCNMARKTVKNHSYSLKNMMAYYNLDFHGHHHALNDAKASAMITVRLLKSYPSLDDYLKKNGSYLSSMKNKASQLDRYNKELKSIKPSSSDFDMTHPFHDKKVAITGTLHMKRKDIVQYIVDHGGTFELDLEQPVDIFIFGRQRSNQPSKKETIIKNKIASGQDILLLSDDKLKQLITFYQ